MTDTPTTAPGLDDCPFCGSPGVLSQVASEYGPNYLVVCARACDKDRVVGNPFAAVDVWNRRRAPSQPAEAPRVSDERLRNTRAWAAARIGTWAGADVVTAACDEALAAREAPRVPMPSAFTEEALRVALDMFDTRARKHATWAHNNEGSPWPSKQAEVQDALKEAAKYTALAAAIRSLAARNGGGPA